jgi:hypothetical protein
VLPPELAGLFFDFGIAQLKDEGGPLGLVWREEDPRSPGRKSSDTRGKYGSALTP